MIIEITETLILFAKAQIIMEVDEQLKKYDDLTKDTK